MADCAGRCKIIAMGIWIGLWDNEGFRFIHSSLVINLTTTDDFAWNLHLIE